MESGIFNLRSPADLFAKLGRELAGFLAAPDDVDRAFNFFVTAEHMLDWCYPGRRGKHQREKLHEDKLLRIVWDLASGAKHFETGKEHNSVIGSAVVSPPTPWIMPQFPPVSQRLTRREGLEVLLEDGRKMAIDIAKEAHEYWKRHLAATASS